MNMSYCRFRNTKMALDDCIDAMEYREETSQEEVKAARNMILSFLDFALQNDIIEGFDEDCIEYALEGMEEE